MKEKLLKAGKGKRFLSIVLALVMLTTLFHVNSVTVYAWDVSNTKLSEFVYDGTSIKSLRVQFTLPSQASSWTACYCYVGIQETKFNTSGSLKDFTMGKHEISKDALLSNDADGSLKTMYGIKALSVDGFNAFKQYMQIDATVELPENIALEAGNDYYFYLWTTRTANEACDEYWSCQNAYTNTDIYPDAYLGKMTIKASGAVLYEDSKGTVKEYGQHAWEYTVNGEQITAKCKGTENGCTYETCAHDTDETAVKLTLSAENPTVSEGTVSWEVGKTVGFTLTGKTEWEEAGLTCPVIKYVGKSPTVYAENTVAPTEVGTYTVKISVDENTASKDFQIIPHTHSYAEGWSKDDTYHWHVATCTHTEEVSGREAHSYGSTGDARFTCEVCGYEDSDKRAAAEEDDELMEAASHVVDKINAIGIVTNTESCKAKIDAARTAYEALTEAQKAKITATQYKRLEDAEKEYVRLKGLEGKYEGVLTETGSVTDITGSAEAPIEENSFTAVIKNSNELETLVNVTPEEKAQGVNVWLEIKDASITMPAADKTKIESAVGDYKVGIFLDASVFKKVGTSEATKVSNLNGKIKISFVVPENLRKAGRKYEIARVHNGVPAVIQGIYDAENYTFTFETDQFSSYALAYMDNSSTIDSVPKQGDVTTKRYWVVVLLGTGIIGFTAVYRRKRINR